MIFSHGRDLGDIVMSLPAIKARGGGELHLYIDPEVSCHGMTPRRVNFIRPLLEAQPYITKVVYPAEPHAPVDVDFGRNWRISASLRRSLMDVFCAEASVDPNCANEPWLELGERIGPAFGTRKIVIARSPRREHPFFPWRNILERLDRMEHRIIFFGTEDERERLSRFCGLQIPESPQLNALQWGKVVAESSLFIGNSSLPMWIAEGLKVPILAELAAERHDSHVCRGGRWEMSSMACDYESIFDTLGL
jgi:hypothetical protein